MTPDSDILDVAAVAHLLGVSAMTVYRMIQDGRLPCFRLSSGTRRDGSPKRGQWRFRRAAIDAWIAKQEEDNQWRVA